MVNFILIFLCISTGIIFSKLRILPSDAHKSLNAWVLYIALPAFSLRFVPDIQWGLQLIMPALTPIVVWCGAWCFVWLYDRKKQLSSGSRTALLVTCGLGNTAFIGFPMIAAYYGESEVHHAIVVDQMTFILFATIGVMTILRTSAGQSQNIPALIIKKISRFPPFLACLTALIVPLFIDISPINSLLDKLVATMSPMALFSIGLQLKWGAVREEWKLLTAGLCYKLLLAPALALVLALVLHSTGNMAKISVFEAGMSSHVTASLLASQYDLHPRYCSLVVGMGIILGFITSTMWYIILSYI
ncbi:MAG: AEC family transporter [Candidatus Azobacteroides sp.]|nr:AEC family transporter [Candidatus Azobacteroides sp.]